MSSSNHQINHQPPPKGQDGHRWYAGLEHCPQCHAVLQTDGYGHHFCLSCSWYDSDRGRAGLALYRRIEVEMLDPPETRCVAHMELVDRPGFHHGLY